MSEKTNKEKIDELKKLQQENVKRYNRQRTKSSKRKIYYEDIVPIEKEIWQLQR